MTTKYRTKEERQIESLNIIYNLKQNGYTGKEEPIRELLDKLTEYVQEDVDMNFFIPYEERNINIVGKLYRSRHMDNMIVMKNTSK